MAGDDEGDDKGDEADVTSDMDEESGDEGDDDGFDGSVFFVGVAFGCDARTGSVDGMMAARLITC